MANLKNRVVTLENRYPAKRENKYVFTTVSGWDNSEIIGFKCRESKILRVIGESFDELKNRAEIFFVDDNSDPRNKIYFIQSLYSENVSY